MNANQNIINCQKSSIGEHFRSYGKPKFRFEWGCVTHPGIWACGGGSQSSSPVLIDVAFQVPSQNPEYGWWCYIGPRPEFENELPRN